MDAVPFYQRCVVVCPSTMSDDRAASLLGRAREHLPSAHLAPLRRRSRGVAGFSASSDKGSGAVQITASTLPPFVSPLESVPPHSLDLVVFAANVFGEEMLHDAPWHMSLAHRCLQPHGVVAIMGYTPRVRVAAPEMEHRDADDFLEDLGRRAREVSEAADSQQHGAALRRAVEISSSLDVGHADTYFPFPSTRRRWFVSEYAATSAQLAASYRALPEYQLLSAGTRLRNSPFCEENIGEAENDDDAVNVSRRRSYVDPLEALQGCLQAREMTQGSGKFVPAPLRIHVRHFVVTCSARSVNAPIEAHQFPPAQRHQPQLK
ncbi:hypothetical protein DQ04_02781040 [Trypanosoma grayi]|uniref:hypothetical protein n=1 Tax=Trypanosoma grayi TaxID=71804 RepID=UPI0004F4995B|nr:hypothetical protein DQ04_02781040 [Trypanosoma grayi]KEG11282.1 hypothetical protein DQ04_02781040 [Trypanosoma grayi]